MVCSHDNRSSVVGAAMTNLSPLAVVKENLLRLMCCFTDVVASLLSSISATVQSFNGMLPDNLLSCMGMGER